MDYLRENLPSISRPKKILPPNPIPCLKIQGANIMNRLSNFGVFKGSCLSVNIADDDSSKNAPIDDTSKDEPKEKTNLQRRTVDAKHISTVSSLVANPESDDGNKSLKSKESQRNNFGLYALKFHRNLTAKANNVILNFKNDNTKRSKSSKAEVTAPNNDLKHEYFEACGHSIEIAQYNYTATDEYCRIELNDDHNMNRTNSFDNNSEQMTFSQRTIAPVRPRRIKSISPNPNSIAVTETNRMKKPQSAMRSRFVAYENAHNIDEKWSEDDSVLNI